MRSTSSCQIAVCIWDVVKNDVEIFFDVTRSTLSIPRYRKEEICKLIELEQSRN